MTNDSPAESLLLKDPNSIFSLLSQPVEKRKEGVLCPPVTVKIFLSVMPRKCSHQFPFVIVSVYCGFFLFYFLTFGLKVSNIHQREINTI